MDTVLQDNSTRIYFSDFFEVSPAVIENYGAFNISLINDLPLFIDPFLLFDSIKPEYQALHENIIRYVKFLRDVSTNSNLDLNLVSSLFCFPEVHQNWLGFSRQGNRGSGLGNDFARSLHKNLHYVFKDFGEEKITRSSHLEKLCLLNDGVGRDHLSDFTTNLIKDYLLQYTQTFAFKYLKPAQRKTFSVNKVVFDYTNRRWKGKQYELPCFGSDFVILTPKDILTKDEPWINRCDFLDRLTDIYQALPDSQLRAQVNKYFLDHLSVDAKRKEVQAAVAATAEHFPQLIDFYIKKKEEDGDEAHKISGLKVRKTEIQFIEQIKFLVESYLSGTQFYQLGNSFNHALLRLKFLKHVIENQDGYRIFYVDGKPIQRESDLQIMYRLTWYASSFDVNREVNNGRGPVDYKVSKGSTDKTLIEFKLASNSKLKQNLQNQVSIYGAANETKRSIKVILHFNENELSRVLKILNDLNLNGREDILLIDASKDNKPSASTA